MMNDHPAHERAEENKQNKKYPPSSDKSSAEQCDTSKSTGQEKVFIFPKEKQDSEDSGNKVLPHYVIIDMSAALETLDKMSNDEDLPTVDTDALLSRIFEGLRNEVRGGPSDIVRQKRDRIIDALMEDILSDYAMALQDSQCAVVMRDAMAARYRFEWYLSMLMNAVYSQLRHYHLYCNAQLHYDYRKRRGKEAIILVRRGVQF